LFSRFGYPDLTYFDRVTDELAAKGVTELDIPENLHDALKVKPKYFNLMSIHGIIDTM